MLSFMTIFIVIKFMHLSVRLKTKSILTIRQNLLNSAFLLTNQIKTDVDVTRRGPVYFLFLTC